MNDKMSCLLNFIEAVNWEVVAYIDLVAPGEFFSLDREMCESEDFLTVYEKYLSMTVVYTKPINTEHYGATLYYNWIVRVE